MKSKRPIDSKVCAFIKKKLKEREYVAIVDIAKMFGVSEKTIRRILDRNNLYEDYRRLRLESKLNDDSQFELRFHKEAVNVWKKKYENLKRELGYEQKVIELFKQAITPFASIPKPVYLNGEHFNNNSTNNICLSEEPVLILSDIHYGAYVSGEETMLLNVYNPEIAAERLITVYRKFIQSIERLKDGHRYRKVSLWLLGDIVEGIIHDELINSETPIADQVIEIAELLSEIVYDLSGKFEEVEVVGVVGNHGRMKQKVHFKNKYSNFDYLVYKFMEVKCSNLENVKFFIPKSSMCIVQKFGKWNFLLRHGDGKSYSYAGIPVYGIIRQSSKLQQSLSAYKDLYIHYEVLGHYHSSMQLPKPSGSIIVCGSIKGIDEYSYNSFLFNEPSQTMLLVNEEDGVFARIELKC